MILTCPITSQGFLTAAFQCFANEMCLQMTFGDQNRLLMEESAQVLGDILHNGLVNVDQGEDQTLRSTLIYFSFSKSCVFVDRSFSPM